MAISNFDTAALRQPQVIDEIFSGAVRDSKAMTLFDRLPNGSTGQMKLRVLDGLPVAYWVDEETNNGRKNITKMAWANKFITYEELAVIVPIKVNTIRDTDTDIWGEVKPRISEAIAKKVDEAVFTGSSKPRHFRADLLSSIIAAGAEVEQTDTLYSAINDAMVLVEESGYEVSGIAGGVDLKGKFRMMLDTIGQPIKGTEIGDLPKVYIDNGAWDKTKSAMIVGDFKQAKYSIRNDVEFDLFTEGVVQDPSTGEILYNCMQDDMVCLRTIFRFGWEIPNPVNALEEDSAVRFPFASIKGSTGVTTYTVTVSTGVAGARVEIGGIVHTADDTGVATFSVQAGDYVYTALAEGYDMVYGHVTVSAATAVTATLTALSA